MINLNHNPKKLVDYLSNENFGGAILIFNHGLGDFVNFLPLFIELKKFLPSWKLTIATNRKGFNFVHPVITLNDSSLIRSMYRTHNFIFNISYPEPVNTTLSKPYYCNEREIGLKNFKWSPYKINRYINGKSSNLVGMHFFGNTNQKNKSLDIELAGRIWSDLVKFGYEPIEIHNGNKNDKDIIPSFINSSNSIRFENPDLKRFTDKISECRFFIGIDSGPLYLAGSILGFDKCIGLEKHYPFKRYLPYSIDKVDILNYKSYKLKLILKKKETGL
jgi:ADP-heptose:LPS heptosyltransferase